MGWVETLPSGNLRSIARNRVTGKRKSRTFDVITLGGSLAAETAADAWWRRTEAEMDGIYVASGVDVPERQRRNVPTFAEWVTEWAGTVDGSKAHRAATRSQARSLAKQWPTQRVDEISEPMARAYLVQMRDAGLSNATREKRLIVLRGAMRAAVKAGHRPDDPTNGVKGPRRVKHARQIITEHELADMLDALPRWLRAAALLSHDAGLRIEEVAGLRMHNLDLLHGVVTVVDVIEYGALREYPKSGEAREVALSARAVEALRAHVAEFPPRGPQGAVFAHPRTGGHCTTAAIRWQWEQARERCTRPEHRRGRQCDGGCVPVLTWQARWHDLRHACAMAYALAHEDIRVIMDQLGHSDPKTTMVYLRRAEIEERQAAAARVFGNRAIRTA